MVASSSGSTIQTDCDGPSRIWSSLWEFRTHSHLIRQYCHGSIEQYPGGLDLWAAILDPSANEKRVSLAGFAIERKRFTPPAAVSKGQLPAPGQQESRWPPVPAAASLGRRQPAP